VQDFRKLRVWAGAHELALVVYRLTSGFPASERYTLANQMRRAAVSVCSNIAEGASRSGDKEFARFLAVAIGSLSELHAQSIIARDLEYLRTDDYAVVELRVDALRRQLLAFHRRLTIL